MENVFSLHSKTMPWEISQKNYLSCTHVFSPVLLVQYDSWGSSVSRNIYKVWKITNTNSTTHRHRAWPPAGRKALSKKNLKLLTFLSANIRITQWHNKKQSVVGQFVKKTIFLSFWSPVLVTHNLEFICAFFFNCVCTYRCQRASIK